MFTFLLFFFFFFFLVSNCASLAAEVAKALLDRRVLPGASWGMCQLDGRSSVPGQRYQHGQPWPIPFLSPKGYSGRGIWLSFLQNIYFPAPFPLFPLLCALVPSCSLLTVFGKFWLHLQMIWGWWNLHFCKCVDWKTKIHSTSRYLPLSK